MIDVLARVLDIAAELAPLVRAHAAAVGFAWRARIALRRRGGSGAPRLGSGTRSLHKRPKTHFLIKRARHCRARRNSRDQTATNGKKRLHAWLSGIGLVAMDAYYRLAAGKA